MGIRFFVDPFLLFQCEMMVVDAVAHITAIYRPRVIPGSGCHILAAVLSPFDIRLVL
jgi:hypothetical protein